MIEYIKNWYQQNFSNPQIVILALCLIVGFTSVLLFGDLLAPLIASIVIAYVLDGVVGLLQHGRIPRLLALLLVFLGFIALLILILFGLIPKLSQQLTQFFRLNEAPNPHRSTRRESVKLSRFIFGQQLTQDPPKSIVFELFRVRSNERFGLTDPQHIRPENRRGGLGETIF